MYSLLHCSEIDGLSLSFCPRDLTYLIQSHFACRWQCHKFFSKPALASKWGRFVDLEKCPLNLYKKRFHCNDGIQTTNLLHQRQACYHWAIRPLTTASVLQVIILIRSMKLQIGLILRPEQFFKKWHDIPILCKI